MKTVAEAIKDSGVKECIKIVKRGAIIEESLVSIAEIDYLDRELCVHEVEDGELEAIKIDNGYYDIDFCSQWQSVGIDGISCDYKFLI